jgi:hypothetical protein
MVQPSRRIKALLRLIEERRNSVLSAFQQGERSLFDLVKQLFSDLPPTQIFLAVSEVSAHVDALCAEGVLKMVHAEPKRYAIA